MEQCGGTIGKTTFPNGKVLIFRDVRYPYEYFGSFKNNRRVIQDYPKGVPELRREVLFRSENMTAGELDAVMRQLILKHRSNDPNIGYNLRPAHHQH